MQGDLIPLEWSAATHTKLAGLAGFDADSPLVRSEVAWIVRGREPEAEAGDAVLDPLFGYSEFEVVLEEDDGEGDPGPLGHYLQLPRDGEGALSPGGRVGLEVHDDDGHRQHLHVSPLGQPRNL